MLCLNRCRVMEASTGAEVGRLNSQRFFSVLLGSFAIVWGAQGWLDSMYGVYRVRNMCNEEGTTAYVALFLCAAYGGMTAAIFVLYNVFSRLKNVQLMLTGSSSSDKSD
jgi:hypothetical protein